MTTKPDGGPSILSIAARRIRAAFVTNRAQAETVTMLTAIMCAVVLENYDRMPQWLIVAVIALYPAIAFVANLIDPIRRDK